MRKHQNFGHATKNKGMGGREKCDEAAAQKAAQKPGSANEKAIQTKTTPQQNHVGGSRAGT